MSHTRCRILLHWGTVAEVGSQDAHPGARRPSNVRTKQPARTWHYTLHLLAVPKPSRGPLGSLPDAAQERSNGTYVRSVWACETSFSQRAGGSKCSAHQVAVRRGSLVAVTQIASFMKATTSPLQLSSKSSSRVNHASGCLPAMCHSTIVPVSAASDVTLVVRRGTAWQRHRGALEA